MPPRKEMLKAVYAIVKRCEQDEDRRGLLMNVVRALDNDDLELMGEEESEQAVMTSLRAQLPGAASSSGQAGAGAGAVAAAGAAAGGQAEAVAAAGAAAAAAAVMPQAEYLQTPMEEIAYQPGPKSSGKCTDKMMYTLGEWQLNHAEIEQFLATSLSSKTVPRPTAMPWLRHDEVYTSESETNDLFFHRACESINNVYAANGVPLAWKVTPSSEQDNMRPDFVLRSSIESSDAGEVDVMVGEGKFPSVLDQPKLLSAVMKIRAVLQQGGARAPSGLRQSLGSAVEQECGYMEARGSPYGFLTCHRYTYFLKRVGDKHYAITRAYLASARDPSVAAILYYLCEKSRQERSAEAGGPSGTASLVPAVGSSGTAAGGPSGAASIAPAGGSSGVAAGPGSEGSEGRPAKLAKTQATAGSQQGGVPQGKAHQAADAPGSAAYSSTPCMIPDGALMLGGRLGEGLCGIVFRARLFGQEVALKSVDAYNSPHLIPHLQCEADVLSGRLLSLQGVCVPTLHAWGHWKGCAMFVVATSIISGRHPEAGQESASAKASAEQALQAIHALGVAHGDVCEENILVDDDDKVWFIDFGSSVVDPGEDVCTRELQELRLIFTASSSPDSAKTVHKHH